VTAGAPVPGLALLSSEQMAELDRRTIEDAGVPGIALMEAAARACVDVLASRFQDRLRHGVSILCGPGNNGGDGLAIARLLAERGVEVRTLLLGDPRQMRGDAAVQVEQAQGAGLTLGSLEHPWSPGAMVVDALFGTGLSRPVEGLAAACIEQMVRARDNGAAILAVDIPSGISGTTGEALGPAVHADITVTFHAPKRGHFLYPGRERRGELLVADIGIPRGRWPELSQDAPRLVEGSTLSQRVPRGPQEGHKGTFGHVLVAAGGPGKAGAARLCAEGALRAGAGLVTLALPEALLPDSVAELAPEVMIERVPGTPNGCFGPTSVRPLLELAHSRQALAIGPGIGTATETIQAVLNVLEKINIPHVVDADALNCLAIGGIPKHGGGAARVLTPHPGEMRRLLPGSEAERLGDRLASVRQLAREAGGIALLKGASTLVADTSGEAWVNTTGNPGMATAGSGDVLTGMIGALLARGLSGAEAATTGALWHGLAGDQAALQHGEPSMLASNILAHLGSAWLAAHEGRVPAATGFIPLPGEQAP